MTTRHKDFTSRKKQTEPVTFTLDKETFTCRPAIPGALLLDFIADADSGQGGRAADAVVDFLQTTLIDEDADRFADFVRDPKREIDIETLMDVVEFLVEEYSARPTQQPVPLRATRSKTGSGSTARRSSRAG